MNNAPAKPPLCADVAIDIPAAAHGQSIYTWLVPKHLANRLRVGHLVWAPLRRDAGVGLVVSIHREPPEGVTLRPLTGFVKPEFALSGETMAIARWMARETASTLYDAASPFFPPGVEHRTLEAFELIDADDPRIPGLTPVQRKIVELLRERGELTATQIRRAMGRNYAGVLRELEEEGFLERSLGVQDKPPKARTARFARLIEFDLEAVQRSEQQRAVLELLAERQRLLGEDNDLFPVADLLRQTGASGSVIAALEKKGLIEVEALPVDRVRVLPDPAPPPVLSPAQSQAWQTIESAIARGDSTPMLLYGVTGSGKTEIYLRMAGRCLRDERGMIVLVPEIALATQIVRRFEERFPDDVAVLHSAQKAPERFAIWQAIQRGEKRIVVGPRSALFAPIERLGAIAIDEEQDPAFKQDVSPRYHARRLAEHIAEVRGVALVLGSATPAVETAWRTTRGLIRRVDLPERVRFDPGGLETLAVRESAPMPDVTVVDMRQEARTTGSTLLSGELLDAIERSLSRAEQAVVLLNRRGMSTIIICRSCGKSVVCPQCDIPMVYHRDRDRLVCHRCNMRKAAPRACEFCGGPLDYFGAGTQRIEQEMRHLFPASRVLRVDRDSIAGHGGFEEVLKIVERGEADIVVGTQVVAKGLDFPRVTTVGVVQADSQLHFPDYRSAERTFQLIAQVAGRAGRRAAQGTVVVQTYTPDHYAIKAAANHSYEDFYIHEIAFRQRFRYPPFSRMARYLFRSSSEETCRTESAEMAAELEHHADERGVAVDILGPAPAFVAKIRNEFQWQIVIRSSEEGFDELLDELPARPGWIVDVEPNSMI
ncbi:MAG: primosomal protein N' [Thermomicrobiales bacterium]|nr:primosomal protein N' [Thermomicrobiales bacterium]